MLYGKLKEYRALLTFPSLTEALGAERVFSRYECPFDTIPTPMRLRAGCNTDVGRQSVDILAFPGHKGLLGPQGTGGLIVQPGIRLEPLIYGGTGSLSEEDHQPEFLPDALESGTLNGAGIAGLGAGVWYILHEGVDSIRVREQALCRKLYDSALHISRVSKKLK